jgi:hypothetical protein
LERPTVDVDPVTSNVFVTNVPINKVTALDLLFVIDNSTSMADKQDLLKQAVPKMVERLVSPDCVTRDEAGKVVTRIRSEPGVDGSPSCPTEGDLEFKPVSDMHIGVITSSLGSHGRPVCDTITTDSNTGVSKGREKNDHAHLIPLVRPPSAPLGPNNAPPSYSGLSASEPFLDWKADGQVATLGTKFANHVAAAGEDGCGFESQLESFYRFLVEPKPHTSVQIVDGRLVQSKEMDPTLVDTELLAQRSQFLRPDSLVAVVVLTDENDCSVMDGGAYYANAKYGHYAMPGSDSQNNAIRMKRSTAVCSDNPNDKCCDTCERNTALQGCEAEYAEACTSNTVLDKVQDDNQVRCFDQQRRFGFDLLYPVERYIEALTKETIVDSVTGEQVPNPLFVSSAVDATRPPIVRRKDYVYFAGIVGVPWQDIATTESLNDPNELSYLPTKQLEKEVEGQTFTRWDLILGQRGRAALSTFCKQNPGHESCGQKPIPPLDPFMVESITAREAGKPHPLVPNEKITLPGEWNNINGSEQKNEFVQRSDDGLIRGNALNDLQYACIFPLGDYGADKDAEECLAAGAACDCDADGLTKERPLCRRTPTSPLEGAQYFGKAYPGTRILEVLHGIHADNAIVASICPKVSVDGPSYGYNPAVTAIVDRFAVTLTDQCLPRELEVTSGTNQVPCVVVETRAKNSNGENSLDCQSGGNPSGGRRPVEDAVRNAVQAELVSSGVCYLDQTPKAERRGTVPCSSYSMCEIEQLAGADATECLSGSPTASKAGYCYVDPNQDLGDPSLVATCPANQKRRLRFVSNSGPSEVPTPMNDTTLFIACIGASHAH